MPVPLNATVCGAPVAVLLIVSVAKNGPGPVGGVNVTLTTQLPPAVIVLLQLLVAWKALGFVPLSGVVNAKLVFPIFWRNTD